MDETTGETLPAANIQVKGTYRGAITNEEGLFDIRVDGFPVTLIFRYIGYETLEVEFDASQTDVEIGLRPVSIELEELVFTGEDPAMHIMERVILRKQMWREELKSWKAEGYTRQNLSNDEGIVSITESYSETWWHHEKGFREVLLNKRQTNNIMPDQNFAGTSYLPNFYDDEISVAGFRVIGVTHPDAFRYYNFRIQGFRQIDNDIVYDIEVVPKTRLQPVFKGTVSVLGSQYALLEVNLVPGDAVFFPPPINKVELTYQQQFNNYGGDFWLPTDVRITGNVEIGMPGFRIPKIMFNQSASITNYEVNIAVPDTLFESRSRLRTDRKAVEENRLFETRSEAIPLSLEERHAYESIDSTMTIDEAFKPTGFLARLGESSSDNGGGSSWRSKLPSVSPHIHYNRVDALLIGFKTNYSISRHLSVNGMAAYNTGLEQMAYGGGTTAWFGDQRRFTVGVRYTYDTFTRSESVNFTRFLTSFGTLLGYSDYFDHYLAEKLRFNAGYRFRGTQMRTAIGMNFERHQSVAKTTDYSIPGGITQRPNSPVQDGILNSIDIGFRYGSEPPPFGIAGSTGFELKLEHSNPDVTGGDFDFTRAFLKADIRINTFLQRRLLPNALDLRVLAFTSTGDLPAQRFGAMDGAAYGLSVFGGFRSLQNRMLEGEHGLALLWEHNFRTVPFELLGMHALVRRSIGIIVHGGHGRTWIDENRMANLGFVPVYEERWRHEVGMSINNLFGFMRFDTTYRIDRPGFYFGISATRFF